MKNKKGVINNVHNNILDDEVKIKLLIIALRPFAEYFDGIDQLKGTSLESVPEDFPLMQSANGSKILISDFIRASNIIKRLDG